MTFKKFITIFLIILFYPIGLTIMWVLRVFTKKTRWIITISFIVAIILGLGSLVLLTKGP